MILSVSGTTGLYCIRCNSMDDPLCAAARVPAIKCEGVACITYVGKMPIPGTDVVIRDCSSQDIGNFCQVLPPDDPDSTTNRKFCVQSCTYSKCNDTPVPSRTA
ncbi:hypothetical protein NP493_208g04003 [Ridgeia piscesae]|uniref:Protein quiver n=1 Tax=Ridgeia piscesae TaxID=27915 RepID=A0AAD9UED8_RIDPI|nr:hypothetical protein NP493_208g04003 [Ridgeia piscesae]